MRRTAPKSWAKYTTCTWQAALKSWSKYSTDKVGRINSKKPLWENRLHFSYKLSCDRLSQSYLTSSFIMVILFIVKFFPTLLKDLSSQIFPQNWTQILNSHQMLKQLTASMQLVQCCTPADFRNSRSWIPHQDFAKSQIIWFIFFKPCCQDGDWVTFNWS